MQMGKKTKRTRRKLSEKVSQRKTTFEAKPNPFEFKINRQKHEVLGRKEKHSKGVPGAARSKAVAKRKKTILLEYKQRNKTNKFTDKRLGEYESDMTPEEKMLARFAAERKGSHSKVDIFNLNDEDELTHFGQSLTDIEKFDDPRSDSEDDDNKMSAEFVKNAHFGGLLMKKQNGDDDKDGMKSRKDLIDDLIAKSKLRKFEKQREKETTFDLTTKLDAEWKDLRHLLPVKSSDETAKVELDSYDLMVREWKFERRAKAVDRLKTPEEIAHEEKEKLEKLEMERLRRMKAGNEEVSPSSKATKKHYSADDLDDGFQLTNDDKKYWLSYKDGMLENELSPESPNHGDSDKETDSKDKAKESESEDEESDEGSDICESENDGSDEDLEETEIILKESSSNVATVKDSDDAADLPYIFEMPQKYEFFLELIERHSISNQLVIVDRIIKCHHPCLAEGNREKLEDFYPMLLHLIDDAVSQGTPNLELVDGLVPHLYDITQLSPVNCAQHILKVILKKQTTFHKACSARASNTTVFPKLNTLIFFKLVSKLFPTSDFQHPVVTPTMLFMGQILMQCAVTRSTDIAAGLFICNLFLEFVLLSKRFIPEVICFLSGVFYSALKKDSIQCVIALPTFKRNSTAARLLELEEDCSNLQFTMGPLSLSTNFSGESITDLIRLNALNVCFKLLNQFATVYESLPSYTDIFAFFTQNQEHLPTKNMPLELRKNLNNFLSQVNKGKLSKRTPLAQAQKKPPLLKLLEPKIQDQFDGRKQRVGSAETLEKQRLLHHYKRELKGAVREMRRDNQFLAKQRLDDQLERDADRKRKLKELYHDLATQEGNCKAIERAKKAAK